MTSASYHVTGCGQSVSGDEIGEDINEILQVSCTSRLFHCMSFERLPPNDQLT